jgi:ornithine cyclodeaminase/alanine dehydrogenase-like protein (mu-crystallin family)
MLMLSEQDVARVLTWDALIPAMERCLTEFSAGQVTQPVRSILTVEENKRFLGVMPAVTPDAMGAKLVAFYPVNAGSPHPTHTAMIVLFDPKTGEPLAAMDGRLITEMRTAAVSAAVTAKVKPRGARVLALLGSGVQAVSHLEALRHQQSFDDVRVWSPTAANANHFADVHNARVTTAEEAVRGADIVVVATASMEPVLQGRWLKPGAHVNAVGACRPNWRELDDETMQNTLIIDSREAATRESGDVILSRATIYAEAGELFANAKPTPKDRTTIFKSLGLAVEDLAAARLVYDAVIRSERHPVT